MKRKIDIYWTPVVGKSLGSTLNESFQEALFFEPEPVLKNMVSTRDKEVRYLKCPAVKDYFKNTFVIKSPIDLSFQIKTLEDGRRVCKTFNYDQAFYDKFVTERFEENNIVPMISLEIASCLFYSQEQVMLEQIPASMSLKDSDVLKNIQIIPGTFDISKWVRPATFSFEVITDEVINIKRGDPLYYVKFIVPDNHNVNFIRVDLNEDIIDVSESCTIIKSFVQNNSMKENYELAAPMLARKKDKLFNRGCPFKKWFK